MYIALVSWIIIHFIIKVDSVTNTVDHNYTNIYHNLAWINIYVCTWLRLTGRHVSASSVVIRCGFFVLVWLWVVLVALSFLRYAHCSWSIGMLTIKHSLLGIRTVCQWKKKREINKPSSVCLLLKFCMPWVIWQILLDHILTMQIRLISSIRFKVTR